MNKKTRALENLHIALWLLKDTAWVSDWRWFGLVMVVPTVFLAFFLAWEWRKEEGELLHNLAVCCWVLANTTWMIGEFYYDDGTRPLASIFFFLGLSLVVLYYLKWIYSHYIRRPVK